jgi:uncharacterized membrane protein YfcA
VQLFVFAGVMLLAAIQMWRRAKNEARSPDAAPARTLDAQDRSGGLGVGALTGFVGVGGGFLIVPALVLLGGLSMRRAVATSLVIIALKSAAGFWKYLEVLDGADASVNWTTIGVFIACGIVGSFVGKSLNDRINQRALQRGFAVFLVVMAGFIAVKESVSLLTPAADPPAAVEEVER